MRDDSGDNEFEAEMAAQLLGHDDEDSEWETEEDAPSFAQLYAAAEAVSKARPAGAPVRAAPGGAGSKKAAQEKPALAFLGINLLEHFDRSYLIAAGLVLGACAASAALLAIKVRLR
jgi:putative intracellular protease/amidase